jgi:hypothetical protein
MNGFVKMGMVMGLFGALQTGKLSRPEVPKKLEAPVGEEVLLSAHAKGVQIYACQAGADQKPAWVLKGPDAELTDGEGKTIAHHFAGPTWKHADGSEVTGKVAEQDAPKANAIPWLLLTAASHRGEGVFRRVTSIQRIRTEGGLAPEANTCDSSANGNEARSAYEADYYFYVPAVKLALHPA